MGSLLFRNDACLVINKVPGESSESPKIENYSGELFPVHRLDMPASGCLLFARTQAAAAFLGEAFSRRENSRRDRRVEKLYWAIIEKPETAIPPEAELVHWLGENRKANKSFAYPKSPLADPTGCESKLKKAVLRYRLVGEGRNYLFLEIELITGRHHQIRAQLAAVGLHIKGDLKYGAKRSEKAGGIRLHAYSLTFPNPLAPNEIIKVKAPPPEMDPLWLAFAEAAAPLEK